MSRVAARSLFALGGASLVALATSSVSAQIARRPYLQRMGPTEVTLVWTTASSTDAVVHIGDAPDALDRTVTSGASSTQHEVRVTGLMPDRTYYYDVGSSSGVLEGGDSEHTFRTAPTPGAKTKMRAWVVGDSGTGDAQQAAVRDAMLAHAGPRGLPLFYVHVGDMAYDAGTTTEFTTNFFGAYESVLLRVPVFPAIGNHEGSSSDSGTQSGPYYTAYVTPTAGELGGVPSDTEAYYSFDWGNVHFIVLDSHDSSRDPDGPMLTWMRDDALATDRDWLVAVWHHPPYTKGTHDSDDEGQLIDMRENALPILEAAGVDLVLGGHSHIYERSFLLDGAYGTPTTAGGHIVDGGDGNPLGTGPYVKAAVGADHDGAVYVVAGHGGAGLGGSADHPVMYFSEVAHGSCLLDVQGNRLAMRNIRADGEVSDRFTIVKGTALVVAAPDGGETLQPEAPIEIRWATVGAVSSVDLDYSLDGGASWQPIAAGIANSGTYDWTVPVYGTYSGLVRVRSSEDAALFDESNGPFSIAAPPIEAIPFGASWKYRDQGADPGADWKAPEAADADWPEGPAQLGYGDDDEATELLDADPNVPTVFFRNHFALDDAILSGALDVIYDDGIAVYVNGTRVFAANVDEDAPYDAYATGDSEDNAVGSASVPGELFTVGDNVVAVEVKQGSGDSSDLSFDLHLELLVAPPDPPPTTASVGAGGGGAGDPGANGADGANGANGANGAGGATGSASSTGAAAGPGSAAGAERDDGCGCHAAGSSSGEKSARASMALGVIAIAALARRRRRTTTIRETSKRSRDD